MSDILNRSIQRWKIIASTWTNNCSHYDRKLLCCSSLKWRDIFLHFQQFFFVLMFNIGKLVSWIEWDNLLHIAFRKIKADSAPWRNKAIKVIHHLCCAVHSVITCSSQRYKVIKFIWVGGWRKRGHFSQMEFKQPLKIIWGAELGSAFIKMDVLEPKRTYYEAIMLSL